MADLVPFLKDRLRDDEVGARAAIEYRERYEYDGEMRIAVFDGDVPWIFTPYRVLAECAAKRRITHMHQIKKEPGMRYGELLPGVTHYGCDLCDAMQGNDEKWSTFCNRSVPGCETLLILAGPYVGHPDFDPDWLQP